MKLFMKKIKSDREKNKNFDKSKQLEIQLFKINNCNILNKLQSELKELNKIQVVNKNLHEIKQIILRDYTGEFEMVGKLSVGDQIKETHIRFKIITDYEAYINAIDEGYETEDAIFNGYFHKMNTSHFNLVERSQYGNGCDFKHEIIEYIGNNCFIPTKGYWFIKCIKY